MDWNALDGTWEINDNRIVQEATEGITRCFTPFGSKDFIASFDVTLTNKKNENTGEAKFIYSNANAGEEYRVDLMYGAGACRISARNWRYPAPLNLIQGIKYPVKIIVKSNRVTVKINGMDILGNISVR